MHGNTAEWIAAVAALLALLISVSAFRIARRSARRQQFIRLHELLVSPESQKGRRILHATAKSAGRITFLWQFRPNDFDLMNRAVSLFHTLAIYTRRGYVPVDFSKDQWAQNVRRSWSRIETYIRWRHDRFADAELWTDMIWFAGECGAAVSDDIRETVASETRLSR